MKKPALWNVLKQAGKLLFAKTEPAPPALEAAARKRLEDMGKSPKGATIRAIEIRSDEELPFDEWLDYPARPTYALRVNYQTGPSAYTMTFWYAAPEADGWRIFEPQPDRSNPLVQKAVEAGEAARGRAQKDVEQIYFRTDPGELTKLREFLRSGRKIEALKRAQTKLGLSLTEANKFVEIVEERS